MAAERIDPITKVRGVIDVFNRRQGRQELALRAAFDQQASSTDSWSALTSTPLLSSPSCLDEIVDRQRRTVHRAAPPRPALAVALGSSAVPGPPPWRAFHRDHPAAACGLHLAQLDGETVDVVLNRGWRCLASACWSASSDAANQRMVAGGGVFERQVIVARVAVSASATNPAKPRADDLRNADRKRSLAPEVA